MKKIFMFIGLLLLLFVAFVLIAGLFIEKDYHFSKSVSINAPREIVWDNIHLLANQQKWSPWLGRDPNIKHTLTGSRDGSIGAVHSWEGNKEVGKGSQTLTDIDPYHRVNSRVNFIEPFESTAWVSLIVDEEQSREKVTWEFSTRFDYPFNVMMLFMDMDKQMNEDFSTGLDKLKQLCEKEAAVAAAH